MAYTKTIVCLANSRREGNFCVAGKEVLGEGGYGEWIRPVNAQNHDMISLADQNLGDDRHPEYPELLDVISIPMTEHTPNQHQQENHRIDIDQSWTKKGALGEQELPQLLDEVSGSIWLNGNWSVKNDRVPANRIHELNGSLLLIRPESLMITVDQNLWSKRREVSAGFHCNRCAYTLKVTDKLAKDKYLAKSGKNLCQYSIETDNVYLCLSLTAKPCREYYYKLVAAIIGDYA